MSSENNHVDHMFSGQSYCDGNGDSSDSSSKKHSVESGEVLSIIDLESLRLDKTICLLNASTAYETIAKLLANWKREYPESKKFDSLTEQSLRNLINSSENDEMLTKNANAVADQIEEFAIFFFMSLLKKSC